jgi:hypothetical protein
MKIVPTNMTIADYCQAMDRGEIVVNRDYQRSDKVWPAAARSYLIETIILGYPLPKLSLHQVTDIKSKKTIKEIVDGQQRSSTILAFYSNNLRLGAKLETEALAGRTFEELEGEDQHRFLDCSLSFDLLVSATREEVHEAFRRINSYTIPLNAEEHRHAIFQGPFKWFVHRITKQFYASFVEMGLFSEKQLVRMNDTKLLSEVCHAYAYGIKTTNKSALDRLYDDRDETFPEEKEWETRLIGALDQLRDLTALHHTAFMRPHLAYSLILALSHVRRPVSTLKSLVQPPFPKVDPALALTNLTTLSEAIEAGEQDTLKKFLPFVKASSSKTNVAAQRATRFRWLCRAMTSEKL